MPRNVLFVARGFAHLWNGFTEIVNGCRRKRPSTLPLKAFGGGSPMRESRSVS
jgi:hypothetical protein